MLSTAPFPLSIAILILFSHFVDNLIGVFVLRKIKLLLSAARVRLWAAAKGHKGGQRAARATCTWVEPRSSSRASVKRSRGTQGARRLLDRRVAIARRETGVFRHPVASRDDDSTRTQRDLD